MSANTDAGFSIGTFTGTGSAGTLGHGLSSAPDAIILKSRGSTADFLVFHKDITDSPTHIMFLNATNKNTDQSRFNDTNPTSSVFSVGPNNAENQSGINYVFYCFHGVEGYSKFGSYVGNAQNYSNGTFVYTGFRPSLVVVKADGTTGSWVVTDNKRASSYNGDTARLYWNTSGAESAYASNRNVELFSNGFKVHGNSASDNSNRINESFSYVYLAFAEAPFKFANAR